MSIYLDFAATSALRPPEVVAAVRDYLEHNGATPGRGAYRRARDAGRLLLDTRRALTSLLGLPGDPGNLVFTHNATDALNTALYGLLREGDAVVVTPFDHNAVLRPLHHLGHHRGVELRRVVGAQDGTLDPTSLERALDGARLLVVNAASNVLGTVLDVPELVRQAREAGVLTLIDAAQTAGHHPVDVASADLVALTGHKGLLGPQGTGALWLRPGLEVLPFRRGGTGGDSREREMPASLPDRFEAGTLNGPGIAGLLAGCRWVAREGVEAIHRHGMEMKARLFEGLEALRGVEVVSPPDPSGTPVVTVVPGRGTVDPSTLAHRLDRDHGVEVRAGLHCAPGVHDLLGTSATGAVRLSPGWATTREAVDRAVGAVDAVTSSRVHPVPSLSDSEPPS